MARRWVLFALLLSVFSFALLLRRPSLRFHLIAQQFVLWLSLWMLLRHHLQPERLRKSPVAYGFVALLLLFIGLMILGGRFSSESHLLVLSSFLWMGSIL